MGSFPGHAVPGSFFWIIALWWSFLLYRQRIRSSLNLPDIGKCLSTRRTQLFEACIIIIFSFIGVMIESNSGGWRLKDSKGEFYAMNDWQHVTMFTAFGLHGIVKLSGLTYCTLVPGRNKLLLGLAFIIEGMLFFFHTDGRSDLDVRLHQLLILAAFIGGGASLLEAWNLDDLFLPEIRIASTLVQGTWFWQTGFILYDPFSEPEAWNNSRHMHSNVMFVTVAYMWHIFGALLVMLVVQAIVWATYRCQKRLPDQFNHYNKLANGNCDDYSTELLVTHEKDQSDNDDL